MNVQKPSRELSVEETLSWTIDLYANNFLKFFLPLLIMFLVLGGFTAFIGSQIRPMPSFEPSASSSVLLNQLWDYLAEVLPIIIVVFVISLVFSSLAEGTCVKYVSYLMEQDTPSLGKAFNFTVFRLLHLLAATVLFLIVIGIGLLVLIVPGLILALMFCLVSTVLMVENAGVLQSFSRSNKLVSGRWLKTFAFLSIVGIVFLFVVFIGSLIGTALGNFGWIATSITEALIMPLSAIAITVHYYSMLAREKERIPPPPPPRL